MKWLHSNILLLISLLWSISLHAQKEDYSWIIGDNFWGVNELNFSEDTFSISTSDSTVNLSFANASMSDRNGDLLFYTNGWSVYDSKHTEVINGDSLNPGWIRDEGKFLMNYRIYQSAIILQDVVDTNLYNLFHLRGRSRDSFGQSVYVSDLLRTVVDCTDKNNIEVLTKNEPIIIDTLAFGGLTACRHGNGRDWWLIAAQVDSGYYVMRISPQGFDISYQKIGLVRGNIYVESSVFSPDGNLYVNGNSAAGIQIFDFDRCSGTLTVRDHIPFDSLVDTSNILGASTGAVAVSPNSKFLYAGHLASVFQFDLDSADIATTKEVIWQYDTSTSDTIITAFRTYQVTPDGRIYISRNSGVSEYHLIHKPNVRGRACNLDVTRMFPKPASFGAPSFPNFRLGRWEQSACDTLFTTIGQDEFYSGGLEIYPNPAANRARIEYSGMIWERVENVSVNVIDNIGRIMHSQSIPEYSLYQDLDVSSLSSGMYFIQLVSNRNTLVSNKLIKG